MKLSMKEKVLTVLEIVFGLASLVFAVVDFTNSWEYANGCWNITFAVVCAVECAKFWETKRKLAITELIFAVVLLAFGVIGLVVK